MRFPRLVRRLGATLLLLASACSAPSADPGDSTSAVSGDKSVKPYGLQADETPGTTYTLTAEGQRIPIAQFGASFQDVDYARFEMNGRVTLNVKASAPITNFQVIPAAAATATIDARDRSILHLTLAGPANLAIALNFQKRLFLFGYGPEANVPVAGAPNVISATDDAVAADPIGGELATQKLQGAIDTLSAQGGGTLVLPAGIYLSGTLTLKDHVTLYLDPDAVLKGSSNPADYPKDPGFHEQGSDSTLSDDARFVGQFMTFSRLLLVEGQDVHIRGRGRIDGNGRVLRNLRPNAVPNIVRVRSSDTVTIEDVLLRDSAAWTLHLLKSTNVTITNVKVINDRSIISTDGIDVDSSQHVAIKNAFVYSNDDGVCLKASNNTNLLGPVSDVTVTGSLVSSRSGAGLKLGTESNADMSSVVFDDADVYDSDRAMSLVVRDGHDMSDVTFKNIRVRSGVTHLVEQVIGIRATPDNPHPTCADPNQCGTIKNLTFQSITAPAGEFKRPASNWTWYMQFRPDNPQQGDPSAKAFQGALKGQRGSGKSPDSNALTGLALIDVDIANVPLKGNGAKQEAEQVANLSIDDESVDLDSRCFE